MPVPQAILSLWTHVTLDPVVRGLGSVQGWDLQSPCLTRSGATSPPDQPGDACARELEVQQLTLELKEREAKIVTD